MGDGKRSRALAHESFDQFVPPEGEHWQFDRNVTDVFDNMLARSIPQYGTMRALVFDLGAELVQPDTSVIDIGCSKGDALAPFVQRFGTANRYIGAELSEAMLEASRHRFAALIDQGNRRHPAPRLAGRVPARDGEPDPRRARHPVYTDSSTVNASCSISPSILSLGAALFLWRRSLGLRRNSRNCLRAATTHSRQ